MDANFFKARPREVARNTALVSCPHLFLLPAALCSPYPTSQDQSNESREARVKPSETESKETFLLHTALFTYSDCGKEWLQKAQEGCSLLCLVHAISFLNSCSLNTQDMILKTDAVAWLSAA